MKELNRIDSLRAKIKTVPDTPGVYYFVSGALIVYVGKSNHLRSRIRSYFRPTHERHKLYQMMRFVTDVHFIECDTNLEARLLEFEMIQELQPIYNVQFKNNKESFFLRITEEKNILQIHRESGFGPLYAKSTVLNWIDSMEKLFPLTGLNDCICYHPIPITLSTEERKQTAEVLLECFAHKKNFDSLIVAFDREMRHASKQLAFEKAVYFRDLIHTMHQLRENLFTKIEFHKNPVAMKVGNQSLYYCFYQGHLVYKQTEISEDCFLEQAKEKYRLSDWERPVHPTVKDIIYSEAKRPDIILLKWDEGQNPMKENS